MPRFYFHIYNDLETNDEEGIDLADAEAARSEAVRSARELICDSVREGQLDLRHRIEVLDAKGAPVLTLTLGEAFELRR